MATQMQLEIILAGNRIATLVTTKESIETKTERGIIFCILIRVVYLKVLSLD